MTSYVLISTKETINLSFIKIKNLCSSKKHYWQNEKTTTRAKYLQSLYLRNPEQIETSQNKISNSI